MQWLNVPSNWKQLGDRLIVKTAPKKDFWCITHYGFIRDNGHFYFDTVSTDFVVEVKIRGSYQDLYDQAGIMLRVDEKHWIKTGKDFHEMGQAKIIPISLFFLIPTEKPPWIMCHR
ncbi:hypothetical protein D082_04340 [Synechocystis sp. PCC 6714]|nr:hypothetical protein D082_04340 [Synechocystis sp. PCC 6714]